MWAAAAARRIIAVGVDAQSVARRGASSLWALTRKGLRGASRLPFHP